MPLRGRIRGSRIKTVMTDRCEDRNAWTGCKGSLAVAVSLSRDTGFAAVQPWTAALHRVP